MYLTQILWVITIILVPALVFLMRMPFIYRNGDLFFSVTVGREFPESREGKEIVRQYRRQVLRYGWFWIVVTWVAAFFGLRMPVEISTHMAGITTVVSTLGFAIGSSILVVKVRSKVMPHAVKPSGIRQASLVPQRSLWTPGLMAAVAGPFVLLALSALYLWWRWDDIPARFPMHFDAQGHADSWGNRSGANVFLPLAVGALITAFIVAMTALMVRQMARKHTVPEAVELEDKAKRGILMIVAAVSWLQGGIFAAFSITVPFNQSGQIPRIPLVFLTIGLPAFIVITILLTIRSTRALIAASRISAAAAPPGVIGDGTEDRFWKLGVFYYNPDDAAVWVPKRLGVGWTFNMARWQAWAWLVGILVVPLLVAGIVALVGK